MEKLPRWAEASMQGIVFWIGHRRAIFRGYLLLEAALVAEVCNLIYANLADDQKLLCEQPYVQLAPGCEIEPGCRADLVVINSQGSAEAVIEVKRGREGQGQIKKDLTRLAALKRIMPNARAMLFLISENTLPRQFVGQNGHAIPGKHQIQDSNAHYRVRRVCKASASFERKNSAHYACVIEVFTA